MVKAEQADINEAEVAGVIVIYVYNITYKVIKKEF